MLNLPAYERFLSSLRIQDKEGRSVPFRLNFNQRKAHQLLLDRQANRNKPVRYISLKARRVGMSSYTEGLLFCHAMNTPGMNDRIVAHLDDAVAQLFRIPLGLVDSLPPSLRIPKPTQDRILVPHPGHLSSELSISTAGSVQGGRGAGFHSLHISEAAFIRSGESFISLASTVPDSANSIVCIESTANGKTGVGQMFYEFWCASVRGETEYLPIFLSWLDDPDCVRDPEEARDAPIDDDERELIKHFKADKAKLAWRRHVLYNRCFGYIDKFLQEYPHVPEVAFIASGNPAFLQEELVAARASVKEPIFSGDIRRSSAGKPVFEPDKRGFLRVWAKPDKERWYYIGVDAARGQSEGDYAAVTVLDGVANEIVASYAAKINPVRLAEVVNLLGTQYQHQTQPALCIIELTGNLGMWVQTELRDKFRYSNLYRWRGRDDKAVKKGSQSLGWETNYRTREMLFTTFRESVRDGGLKVRDERIVQQMDSAQRDSDRIEIPGHDDQLFSAMLANIACRQWPPPKLLGFKKPSDEDGEEAAARRIAWKDDSQLALARHYREVMSYTERRRRQKSLTDRLDGI